MERASMQYARMEPGPLQKQQAGAAPLNAARLSRAARFVRGLSWATFAFVLSLTVVLWWVSEGTWWGTVFTYFPRHVVALPAAAMLVCSVCFHRRSIFINIVSLAFVAGPLMGGRLTWPHLGHLAAQSADLKIVSCNVQFHGPDFQAVLEEMSALSPDVVALQESFGPAPLIDRYFPEWHTVDDGEYRVISRFPLRKLDVCRRSPLGLETALSVIIESPRGPFALYDVHLSTVRRGLTNLSWRTVRDGSGPQRLERLTQLRLDEALETRTFIEQSNRSLPKIVVGDFNTPTVSSLYRDVWPAFLNAFDEAGSGFGYTAPCQKNLYWLNDVPWLRIDHILADRHWSVPACGVGRGGGSDHRLIWAVLSPG